MVSIGLAKVWHPCHTFHMKMTMHIDEALLERVKKRTGAKSKTEAVRIALEEMDRKARLAEYGKEGMGLSPDELANAVDPNYDVMAMRVAEGQALYGAKKAST